MSSNDVAIRVQNLSKCYQIYDAPHDRLKQFVLPRFQRLAGKAQKQYFREFWALNDVSFEIRKGETVGIIGRNGSGKSTLLQLICGTLTPTNGDIAINGKVAALLELGAGFNPEFTGRENVYMTASLYGLTREEIDTRFEQITTFADIGQFIDQAVKTYSSGMYVRLAFAVIAHVDADILVIDEALSVGDVFFVQKCMRFLRKFMEQGTVLFVSHDTGAVLNFCEKSIWLHHGNVVASGSPKKVTELYLEKLYEEQQGESVARKNLTIVDDAETNLSAEHAPARDMRQDFINQSQFRNDIELFSFSPNTQSFGAGGVEITDARLLDKAGSRLTWVVGGEPVQLVIQCLTHQTVFGPIVGFTVKDRLGQEIFVDNTYLTYAHKPLKVSAEEQFEARFRFVMPLMPTGDYTISMAVAEGSQEEHIQHEWKHDALAFKVHASSARMGLIGIPMESIELNRL